MKIPHLICRFWLSVIVLRLSDIFNPFAIDPEKTHRETDPLARLGGASGRYRLRRLPCGFLLNFPAELSTDRTTS
jgi:hypothetical protein